MLFAPLTYLSIRHPIKRRWDISIPAISTILFTTVIVVWPKIDNPFSSDGYIHEMQSMYATLGGFFITSLTVITSIGNGNLDEEIQGIPYVTIGKDKNPITRRRFLGYLFGYLSLVCFLMYIVGIIVPMLYEGSKVVFPLWIQNISYITFLLIYNAVVAHLFLTTLLGLYYFSDRLQRPKAEILRESGEKN